MYVLPEVFMTSAQCRLSKLRLKYMPCFIKPQKVSSWFSFLSYVIKLIGLREKLVVLVVCETLD